MCGRLNVTDSSGVRALCEQLDISLWPEEGMIHRRFIRATDRVSVVLKRDGMAQIHNAIWWLLLDSQKGSQGSIFKPSKYTSFNTRYDKLTKRGSAGYQAFRQQRCIIPATGFGETLGSGSDAKYHDLIAADDANPLAMGGLYRWWKGTRPDGCVFYEISCSVVTVPPHPKLEAIHRKASPLMLSFRDGSIDKWLDDSLTNTDALLSLLEPKLRHSFVVKPIDKPSTHNQVGESFVIDADR
ncbi:SOS response-associated peptidase family protein [Alteromonas sp. H39]|uniref:SOS response-associated peptidase family protein n=1 Tax=Alteromonas sp. H39 TaxID=3389876 RepID=UPI0039E02DCA